MNRRLRLAIYSVFALMLCPVIPDYGSRRDHLFDANDNYSSALDTLRHYEGLETSPYYLIDGTYIGYGHKNREGLKGISKEQADSILDADMGYCLTRAQKRTGLYGDKSIAVALMFFTMGEDRFCKTDIYKRFSSGDVSNLNITDYCIINGKENARKKRFLTFVEHLFTNE